MEKKADSRGGPTEILHFVGATLITLEMDPQIRPPPVPPRLQRHPSPPQRWRHAVTWLLLTAGSTVLCRYIYTHYIVPLLVRHAALIHTFQSQRTRKLESFRDAIAAARDRILVHDPSQRLASDLESLRDALKQLETQGLEPRSRVAASMKRTVRRLEQWLYVSKRELEFAALPASLYHPPASGFMSSSLDPEDQNDNEDDGLPESLGWRQVQQVLGAVKADVRALKGSLLQRRRFPVVSAKAQNAKALSNETTTAE